VPRGPLRPADDEENAVKPIRRLAPLVLVAFAAGAIAAHADSVPKRKAPTLPVARAVPAVAAVAAARPLAVCRPAEKPATTSAPPSQALLDAFAILRRERRPEDTLPPEALEALKRRDLAPVSPESARLLRTGPDGGRAWVVPVPDVTRGFPFDCGPDGKRRPREGLAVVALQRAAPGGGGALDDLVRGRAPVWVDPCAGEKRDMLGVSGIVPNGVAAVFLTAPDGTAVRADVKDNGYEFLIPRSRTIEQRYVVWTGGDGTPHVQPVTTFGGPRRPACPPIARLDRLPIVTPVNGLAPCSIAPAVLPAAPTPRKRVVPVPVSPKFWAPCPAPFAVPPVDVRPIPAPSPKKPPRTP
jgi:hypothetical protein